ncbi:Rmf/CrpP fold protein [Streptomyces sp. NPDC006784]|uniref:Rmf/CrpP fold protein n=1 Tax=Streptomyces sp. NPDC006784 TaxID=3364764 RepID=UPI00369AB492
MGTREDTVRAVTAGREAGRRGDRPTACPHPSGSCVGRGFAATPRRARYDSVGNTRRARHMPTGPRSPTI